MATWKKIITSGSNADLNQITSSGGIKGTLDTAAQTNITSVGALDGGSITSGFGNIDIGTSTLNAGNTTVNTLTNDSTVAGSSITGSFTGSFIGDGSGLTGTGFNIDELSNSLVSGSIAVGDLFAVADINDSNEEKKITFQDVRDAIFEDVSSDATIAAGGALTIANDSVNNDKLANIARGSIKVGGSGNAPTDLNAKTSGQILVGDGTDIASVAVSGDVTLASNGAVTIANDTIGNDELKQDDDITLQSLTTTNNVTVGGNLVVNGTTTTIATANTEIKDQFLLLASGSSATPVDAGIIVQSGSVAGSGSAFYHDMSDQRWSVAKAVDVGRQAATTPLQFVTTVKTDTVNPSSTSGSYGAGEMHVNTSTGEIWIRFG